MAAESSIMTPPARRATSPAKTPGRNHSPPRAQRGEVSASCPDGGVIRIVPATLDHARAITLRDGDAAEIAALGLGKE